MHNAIPVLTFHHIHPVRGRLVVPPDIFEAILTELAKRHTFITYNQFKEFLTTAEPVPKHCLLLTLDDGYLDNYIYAFPILKRLNIPGVMFVVTGFIQTLQACRQAVAPINHHRLWEKPAPDHFISTAELKAMHQTGLMDFSSHTATHMACHSKNKEAVTGELTRSYRFIHEMACEDPPYGFCWPGGVFDATAMAAIKQSPYRLAFSTIDGGWRRRDDPYTIRRIDCSSYSGDRRDYFFRIKKKLFIYTTPVIGDYYSRIKHFKAELRRRRKRPT